MGFVLSSWASGSTAQVYIGSGVNTGAGLTGLTPGQILYLSTVPGDVTTTPPSTTAELVQHIGFALTSASMYFTAAGQRIVI